MATTPEKWKAVKQLFEAAIKQDAARRLSFLKELCKDDGVRCEVEQLFAEHDQAGASLSALVVNDLSSRERHHRPAEFR